MRINYNATAMLAVNALNKNDSNLSVSTGKLSSGYKINRSKDDPSGYALSRKMRAQLEGLMQARDNSDTGVNIIKAVDGALSEINDMLQRIYELAIKGSTGTLSDGDRELADEEVQKLKEEIQRVSETFEFNGQKLLDGSFQLKGYTKNINVKIAGYDERVDSGIYKFDLSLFNDPDLYDVKGNLVEEAFNTPDVAANPQVEVRADPDDPTKPAAPGTVFPDGFKGTVEVPNVSGQEISIDCPNNQTIKATIADVNGTVVTLQGPSGFEVKVDIRQGFTEAGAAPADGKVEVEITGFGPMNIQVGGNEGQELEVEIPEVGIQGLGIVNINTRTKEDSLDTINKVSAAIDKLSGIRSKLGAYQNRLESVVESNEINHENMTAAYSGILDTDISEEYTTYSTYQILSQASTSVLAQANERPAQVLQLLQ